MAARLSVLFLIISLTGVYAQAIRITGTVSDTAGNKLSEASVKLVAQNIATITDYNGTFTLNAGSAVNGKFRENADRTPFIQKGMVRISLDNMDKVSIHCYDISGRLRWTKSITLKPGDYSLRLPTTGSQVLLINVTIAQKTYQFKTCTIFQNGNTRLNPFSENSNEINKNKMAKSPTALDSISVSMGSFLPVKVPVATYSGNYDVTLHRIPFPVAQDRLTTWNPGLRADKQLNLALGADGLPVRTTVYVTLNPGDNIQNALNNCPEGSVVFLKPGIFTVSTSLLISKGIVLRGSGSQGAPTGTTLAKSGGQTVIGIGPDRDSPCYGGTGYSFTADGIKESRIVAIGSAVSNFSIGDLALIDVVDDATIQQGDGTYFKRVSGRSCSQRVEIAAIDAARGQLVLDAPLHWNFKAAAPYNAQIVRVSRPLTKWAGVENLRIQWGNNPGYNGQMAGGIDMSNAVRCWVKDVQTDSTIGGMHVCLTSAYRCVIRDNFFHHSATYNFGADCYGIVLRCGSAENLVENNIVRYMNKPILFNVSGGGNVVGYNYADNSWATPPEWQEVNIDCHCSFPHMELMEGNFAPHMGATTTHGNAGYLTYFRNFSSSQFAAPAVVGFNGNQTGNVNALQFDAGDLGMNVVGNVLGKSGWSSKYDSYSNGAGCIYELGGADDISVTSLVRQGNYDYVNNKTMWYPSTAQTSLPASLYLSAKPAWWPAGSPWPWAGSDLSPMVGTLPAKARAP